MQGARGRRAEGGTHNGPRVRQILNDFAPGARKPVAPYEELISIHTRWLTVCVYMYMYIYMYIVCMYQVVFVAVFSFLGQLSLLKGRESKIISLGSSR